MVWCVLTVLALGSPSLNAQTGISQDKLTPDIIHRDRPTPEDEGIIAAFADENLALIESGSAKEMKGARETLQEVARSPGASAQFRRLLSQTLLGRLNALALGEDSKRSVVAILVIGDLGTPQAVRALDDLLELDQDTQRFAAVIAYRSAFQSMSSPQALIGGQAPQMIKNLGKMIEKDEKNPLILDVSIRAMKTAADVGNKAGLAMGNLALDRLVTSVSARVRSLATNDADAALFEPCVKATQDIRGILALQSAQERADPAIVRDAGGLCGHLFGYVFRRVRQDKLPVVAPGANLAAIKDARKNEISALKIADDLVRLCKDELEVGNLGNAPIRLAPRIGRGNNQGDQQYIRDVMSIIGDGGLLTQTGFGFDSNDFLRGG